MMFTITKNESKF